MLKSRAIPLRWLGYLVIGLSLWLRWPILSTGFTVDDYAQLAMMRGDYPVPRAPLALFTFSDGSERENDRLKAVGFFPWWSHPQLRVSLLRPLASALMWLDFHVFGRNAFLYHLHSAAWWVSMLLVVYRFQRELLDETAALIALLIFSLHPGHNLLLGWIANRNAIVSTTFGVLGLIAQLDARENRARLRIAIASGCYVIALTASEYALGFLAYGAAFAAANAKSWSDRRLRLAGWVALIAVYIGVRAALGFGTHGSGMYLDPLREPAAFMAAAAERLPVLVGDAVLAVRSTWWSGGFPWAWRILEAGWIDRESALDLTFIGRIQVGFGIAACLIATWILRHALRSTAYRDANAAGPLAWGALLALVPALASLPESRLMLPALLGWTALISSALRWNWQCMLQRPTRAAMLSFAALASLTLLEGFAPMSYAFAELRQFPLASAAVRKSMVTDAVDRIAGSGKIALLASAVDPTTTIYVPMVRQWYDHPGPESCHLLMGGYGPLRLTRLSENQFELAHLEKAFTAFDVYASTFNRGPIKNGQVFRAGQLTVEVLAVDHGRPEVARFTLDRSLDSSDVVLLTQTSRGLIPFAFPEIGQNEVIPPAALPVADRVQADLD